MRRGTAMAAAATAGMILLSGCSVQGNAVRGPIDLDTGVYKSKQADKLGEATREIPYARLRGIRLAEYMAFPHEVDADLVEIKFPIQPLATTANAAGVFGGGEIADLPVLKQFQYGYVVTAGGSGLGSVALSHAVLVFDNPASAQRAASEIAPLLATEDEYTADAGSLAITGTPAGTKAVKSKSVYKGTVLNQTVAAVTPIGSMLMYSWAEAEDLSRAENIVRTALTKQHALLTPTPVISQDRNPDPTGLIRGTLAGGGEGDPLEQSVYGPRGAALQFSDQSEAFAAMEEADVSAAAMDGSDAYRTGSAKQAGTWADYLMTSHLAMDDEAKKAPSPRDLPTAHCWTAPRRSGCTVVVGRYVGDVRGDTLKDAQQRISAQSLFLAEL